MYTIRDATSEDAAGLLTILDRISDRERKYLALQRKLKLIKSNIRKGSHVTVAEDSNGSLVGFLRESGRPGNRALLEEIYVLPEARRSGVARQLIEDIIPKFSGLEAKTFSDNSGINTLLKEQGFNSEASPKGTMLTWYL